MARSLIGNYEEINKTLMAISYESLKICMTRPRVQFSGSTGDRFRTAVGVRQGCLLSPTIFNIFLTRIVCETLDDHEGSVSIGGRLITNFRFADDIVVNAEEEESGVLVDHLDTTTRSYRIEIYPDKTNLMTSNPNSFQKEIKIKGQRLGAVANFKYMYLRAIIP